MRNLPVVLLVLLLMPVPAHAQSPGDAPPKRAQQRLRALALSLESALNARDRTAIDNGVTQMRAILGPFAGIPESPEKYHVPVNDTQPDYQRVVGAWQNVYDRTLSSAGSRSPDAAQNKIELRRPAYIALACIAAAQAGLPDRDAYLARAREELDYLLARQDESGLFPYPAFPVGAPPNVVAMVKRIREEQPQNIRNGYLYINDDGMQFDVGCAGVAMCEGHRVTGDRRYLESAERAGAWAIRQPLSTNWNYNAFSVWLLASLYDITGRPEYLHAAVDKTEFGVLPGLMETGRWVDQHNAKQSYHFVMVRSLSILEHAMPAGHPAHEDIRAKLRLAVRARSEDILRDGVSNVESALWGLATVLEHQGEGVNERALNAIVNALLKAPNPDGAAVLPFYLRARTGIAQPSAAAESGKRP